MKAPGTLLFFHTMFGDPESFGWQVHHLTPLWHGGFLGAQVVLAALTAFNGMHEDVIRLLHLLEMMPTVRKAGYYSTNSHSTSCFRSHAACFAPIRGLLIHT